MNSTVTRSISGLVFLVVMIGSLLGGKFFFLPLFLFIQAQMMKEYYQITLGNKHMAVRNAAIAVAILSFGLVFVTTGAVEPALPVKFLGITLLLFVGLLMYMVVNHQDFKEYAYVLAGLLYIGLPVALSPFVVSTGSGYSGLLMLAFFIIIWSSDVGAYCFGMLFGQKLWPAKMCPEISPKKSWAGFFGGWLTVLLAAYILLKTGMIAFPLVHVLVMASLMHITGVFGDLYESLWKRQFGVKDSGNIMPGHGGLLDRFDSALFAIPTAYVYLVLFELV